MAVISITIPDDLQAVYARFQQENSVAWCDAYVTEKLKELRERFLQADVQAAIAGTASPATKAALRIKLGL